MDPLEHLKKRGQDETPVILIVEDEVESSRLIASELENDYQVIEASDGQEGLEKALEQMPDLVVIHLIKSPMDGIELCSLLKAGAETSLIQVILLGTDDSIENQIHGLEAGADDYIVKPFSMALFKTRVRNLLEVRRLLRLNLTEQIARSVQVASGLESDLLDMPPPNNRMERKFLEKVVGVLKQNYTDPDFNVGLLASELNMSQRTILRKIKTLTGQTPVQFIAEYRLKKAVLLLDNSDYSAADIAVKVGFGDLSHFYRIFRKTYGMNPSQYRVVKG